MAAVVDKMDAGLDTTEKWLRIRVAESVARLLDPVFDRPDGLAPLHGRKQFLERLAKRMRCRSTLGFELGHLLRVAVVVVAHLFLSTRAWRPIFAVVHPRPKGEPVADSLDMARQVTIADVACEWQVDGARHRLCPFGSTLGSGDRACES